MSVKAFAAIDDAFKKTTLKDVSSLVRSKDFNANEKLRLFGLSQGVALNKKSIFGKTTSVNKMNLTTIADSLRERRARAKKPKSLNLPLTSNDKPPSKKSNLKILTSPSIPRLGKSKKNRKRK
jgi:hypothetical protein